MQSPIHDYWSTLVIYAFILFYFHYTCFIHINEFICILYMQMKIVPTHCCRYWNIGSNGSATCLDTAMAQKKGIFKKIWGFFFLLIQQFWLMGTTSIPQPVITTAQFPICTLHAGTTQVVFMYANFPHFSGPSPFLISKSMWANGVSFLSPWQVITCIVLSSATMTQSWLWEESWKQISKRHGKRFVWCSISALRFDWQAMLTWVVGFSMKTGALGNESN